jgi:hypothetical protein
MQKCTDSTQTDLRTVAHAAGVLAALSPNEGWTTNVSNAWTFLETDRISIFATFPGRCWFYTAGFDPEWVLFRGGVNFKVQSFYKNIADPETPGPVTIDRHAKGIVYNDPGIAKLKPHATRVQYDAYELMYTKAASEVGMMPHQLQAVTWLAWRGVVDSEMAEQIQLVLD